MRRLGPAFALAILAASVLAALASATGPALTFSVFEQTDLPLGQVVWTGSSFLYLPENLATIETADASGAGAHTWLTFAGGIGGEEIRCTVPPNAYWPDGIYCHLPDDRIYRIARDGSAMTLVAQLPGTAGSDGGIAFDSGGRFGYSLLASTGGSDSDGGQIFAVHKGGDVRLVGSYPGPGGADELAIAPAHFGSASGELLISVDQDAVSGRLLAIDRTGKVRYVATGLGNGLNPIVVVAAAPAGRRPGQPPPGLYVPDTNSMDVFYAPAAALAPYSGEVLVGTELGGSFWLVKPNGYGGFVTVPVAASFPPGSLNLEGAAYIP